MNKIMRIVKKYNLKLIEDCAHSIESKYKNKHVKQNTKHATIIINM